MRGLMHRLRASWAAFRDPDDRPRLDALSVLCRAFEDGHDAHEEWLAWYEPTRWLSASRALGAFIWGRLAQQSDYQRGLRDGWERGIESVEYHARETRRAGPEHRPAGMWLDHPERPT